MHVLFILLLALMAGGCAANVKLGAPFDAANHGAAAPHAAKVIVYQNPTLRRSNYHFVVVNADPPRKIARGGFTTFVLPPGEHSIDVRSRWVAELPVVDAYREGAPGSIQLDLQRGETTYLMVKQRIQMQHVECQIDGETARICTVGRPLPELQVQATEDALAVLTGLKEICHDCK
jgi:hypothetical protein